MNVRGGVRSCSMYNLILLMHRNNNNNINRRSTDGYNKEIEKDEEYKAVPFDALRLNWQIWRCCFFYDYFTHQNGFDVVLTICDEEQPQNS